MSVDPGDVKSAREPYRAHSNANGKASGTTSDAPPLVQFIDHDELFDPDPKTDQVVSALGIAPGPATGLFGQSWVGKSILAMSGGMSTALGRDFWGLYGVRRGRWAHFDYEQGRRRVKALIQRLSVGFDASKEDLRDWVRVAVYPPLTLRTPGAIDHYSRAFDGCTIATLDALKGLTPGIDENSSEMRDYMGVLARASEKTGCTPLVVHNAGKSPRDGNRPRREAGRGSSAIFDECGSVFVATAEKGEPTHISHEKDRELGATIPDFYLRIDDVPTPDGNPKGGLRVVHLEAEQAKPHAPSSKVGDKFRQLKEDILAAVRAEELTSANAICARVVGGNKTTKLQAVEELKQERALLQPGGEGTVFRAAR